MTTTEQILCATAGYVAEDYNGRKGKIRDKEWRAKLDAIFMGDGAYVRIVKVPLLIVARDDRSAVLLDQSLPPLGHGQN